MKIAYWIMASLMMTAAHAQDVPERLTVPLEIASNPRAFAGSRVEMLCSVIKVNLGTYVCPAADQIGHHLADIAIRLDEMSEADCRYIVSRCSAGGAVQPCNLVIAGTIEVSENGALSLSRPRLKF